MILKKTLIYTLSFGLISISMVSCVSSGDEPGIEYAPNMYVSQAYEPYSQEKKFEPNPNGMTMRLPVAGSVARGQLEYIYPHENTIEGYEASALFTRTIPSSKENVQEGERLYNIYCWHCHGKKGANDGPIFKSGKMPPPPWAGYTADYVKQLPEGKIYHTITYGKGLMGSHAHMLNPEQRWQVIHYVKYLSLGADFVIQDASAEVMVVDTMQQDSIQSEINN